MTRTPFAELLWITGLLCGVAGCRPGTFPDLDEGCDKSTLSAGEVRAYRMTCSDVHPSQGIGRKGDWLLENERLKAVIRKPEVSLGFIGLGGGTLVDLAEQGGEDLLWEALPILDGGWMQPLTMEGGVDRDGGWVRVSGYAQSLDGEDLGRDVEFTWRLKPDVAFLEVDDADGLVLQGRAGVSLQGRWWKEDDTILGVASDAFEDWGGAVRYDGSVRLAVGSADSVGAALWPGGERVSGTCLGGGVRVEDENLHLATLGQVFDTRVPSAETLLVCEAESHADGLPQPAGENLELETGLRGAVRVRVADDSGVDVPVLVRWEEGVEALAPGGGLVPTGPGRWSLQVDRGPRFDVLEAEFDVLGEVAWDVVVQHRIPEEGWVLAQIGRETHPSRFERTPPADDLDFAAAAGVGFVMQAAVDEIVVPSGGSFSTGWLRNRAGVLSETSSAGRVWSWPWEGTEKKAGHGAPDWHGVTAVDLAAVAQGAGLARRVVVDTAWMEAAGPVHAWDPAPDAMFVSGPQDVAALVDALQSGAWIGVVGPLTWLPVDASSLPSVAACERPIVLAQSVATNGMLLELDVAQGQWAPSPRPATTLEISIQGRSDLQVDSVSLWSDGTEIRRWEPSGGIHAGWSAQASAWSDNWVLVVAEGNDWAVTSPLWLPAVDSDPQP